MYYLSVISICLNLTTSFNYHKCVSMVSFGVSEDLGLWHLFNIKEVGISLLEIVSIVLNYGYFVSGRLSQKKYENNAFGKFFVQILTVHEGNLLVVIEKKIWFLGIFTARQTNSCAALGIITFHPLKIEHEENSSF